MIGLESKLNFPWLYLVTKSLTCSLKKVKVMEYCLLGYFVSLTLLDFAVLPSCCFLFAKSTLPRYIYHIGVSVGSLWPPQPRVLNLVFTNQSEQQNSFFAT
jgi:hypothetical protein